MISCLKTQLSFYLKRIELEYRDWSFVHLMGRKLIPSAVITPSIPQVGHIGLEGLHGAVDAKRERLIKGNQELKAFHGTKLDPPMRRCLKMHERGYGGWGHPADQQHCIKLFPFQTGNSILHNPFAGYPPAPPAVNSNNVGHGISWRKMFGFG